MLVKLVMLVVLVNVEGLVDNRSVCNVPILHVK